MERGHTKLGDSYWDKKGYYQDDYNILWNNLVPSSGEADTVHGELIRAIGRLYYDYCNNGNINAVDCEYETEYYDCYSCNGSGEQEVWNGEEDEVETCDECGGDGEIAEEVQGNPFIAGFFSDLVEFLHKNLENKKVVDDLESYMLNNFGFYRYDDKSMNVYDKVVDEVVYTILTTENKPLK